MNDLRAKARRWPPLYLQILIASALALICGPLLGKSAAPLGEIGKLVIQLIKAVATPLLFLVIIHSVVQTRVEAKAGARMVFIALINTSCAIFLGLFISNVFQPGRGMMALATSATASAPQFQDRKINFLQTLASYIPSNLVQPFAENVIISVILLALLFGFALRKVRDEPGAQTVIEGLGALLRVTEVILVWVIHLVPLAVFAVLSKTVGEHGFAPLRGLSAYVGVGLLGLLLHSAIVYNLWIWLGTNIPVSRFWREAREPMIYAMGINSSLATLPVTLKALDRLKVSRESSTLGACVGTNLNNDGIVLYEGMAVLFVAQASGIDLSLSQQVLTAVICMFAAIGVAGVPEAGFISLALVLNSVGLPVELLPVLLTVDWIVARARSVTNVLSDMVLSSVLDRWREGSTGQPFIPSVAAGEVEGRTDSE